MRQRTSTNRRRRQSLSGLGVLICLLGQRGPAAEATQSSSASAPSPPATQRAARKDSSGITPVEGPSTLHQLGLTIEGSSMGWDGQWGSPPSTVAPAASHPRPAGGSTMPFVLGGADLYRVSCRACHKPDGSGAPPEINSMIGPVQSASLAWMTRRMKEAGRPVDAAFLRKLTSDTEADIRKRLRTGGHNMPSFDHLSDREISVLRPYLDELADIPGASARRREISVPPDRVGELIVKGTCHICHDAVGERQPATALNRVIPSLASFMRQKTAAQVVPKVHAGAPIPLGTGSIESRGRMPVFNYLTEAEVAAAYAYLLKYPPK